MACLASVTRQLMPGGADRKQLKLNLTGTKRNTANTKQLQQLDLHYRPEQQQLGNHSLNVRSDRQQRDFRKCRDHELRSERNLRTNQHCRGNLRQEPQRKASANRFTAAPVGPARPWITGSRAVQVPQTLAPRIFFSPCSILRPCASGAFFSQRSLEEKSPARSMAPNICIMGAVPLEWAVSSAG